MATNKDLQILLSKVDGIVTGANSKEDLSKIFPLLNAYVKKHGEIAFDDRLPWKMVICGVLTVALGFYFRHFIATSIGSFFWLVVLGGGVYFAIEGLRVLFFRYDKIVDLSDRVFEKDVYFDNDLTPIEIEDPHALWKDMSTMFVDLQRGDEQQEIKKMIGGSFKGAEHSISYKVFHFHYVEIVENDKGRIEYHYDRYGVICDFPFAAPCSIFSSGMGNKALPFVWTTASQDFNHFFPSVRCQNEVAIAKFLAPVAVMEFLQLFRVLTKPNFQLAEEKLCLTLDNEDVIKLNREHGIDNPIAFETELSDRRDMNRLSHILSFIHQLMKYNDCNYS